MPIGEAALALRDAIQNSSGDGFAEIEELSIAQLNTEQGIQLIKDGLKVFDKSRVVNIGEKISSYENISRKPGELIPRYAGRFRNAETESKRASLTVHEGEARGYKFLTSCKIPNYTWREILQFTHHRYDFDKIVLAFQGLYPTKPPPHSNDGKDGHKKGGGKGNDGRTKHHVNVTAPAVVKEEPAEEPPPPSGSHMESRREAFGVQVNHEGDGDSFCRRGVRLRPRGRV